MTACSAAVRGPGSGPALGRLQSGGAFSTAQPLAQALDQGRGGQRLAVVVRRLPGEGDGGARREELGEEVALLVEPRALDRHVREHPLEDAAQVVRQQGVLADAAREDVAVQAHQEEVIEGARAGLGHREHLDAAPLAAEVGTAPAAARRSSSSRRISSRLQPEARRHLALQLLQGGGARGAASSASRSQPRSAVSSDRRRARWSAAGASSGQEASRSRVRLAARTAARIRAPWILRFAGVRLVAPRSLLPLLVRASAVLADRLQALADGQGDRSPSAAPPPGAAR